MSDDNTQLAAPAPIVTASTQLSAFLGIEKGMMIDTIKRQCFKNLNPDQVTDAQLASFISVASQFKVNVMLPGFLYCYPERNGGIQVMIGPDLMFKLLSEHADIDSWETKVYPEDVTLPPTHAITHIYRKSSERPITYTALLSEWRVNSNPNWSSRPRHMLSIRSLKQAARQLIHGLPYDEDEKKIAEMINVTDSAQPAPERPAPPPKAKRGAAAVKENPAPDGVIETSATPVPETPKAATPAQPAPVEAPAPAAAAPAPEPVAAPAPAPKPTPKPAQATKKELKDGERGVFTCEIVEFVGKLLNVAGTQTPSVKALVKGEFEGEIYHLNGAKAEGEKVICPSAWQIEHPVDIELLGVMNTRSNRVIPQVQSIKEHEEF